MYLSLLSGHLLSCNWVSRVGEGEAIPTLNCEPVVIGRLLEAYLGLPSGNISCSSICSHLNINSDRSRNSRSLFLSIKPLTSYVTLAINKKSQGFLQKHLCRVRIVVRTKRLIFSKG